VCAHATSAGPLRVKMSTSWPSKHGWGLVRIGPAMATSHFNQKVVIEDVRAGGNPSRMYVEKQLVGEEQEVRTDRSSSGFPGTPTSPAPKERVHTDGTQGTKWPTRIWSEAEQCRPFLPAQTTRMPMRTPAIKSTEHEEQQRRSGSSNARNACNPVFSVSFIGLHRQGRTAWVMRC